MEEEETITLRDGRKITISQLEEITLKAFKEAGKDVLTEKKLHDHLKKNLKISEDEALKLCWILMTDQVALLSYTTYRNKLAYRLLRQEERELLREMAWYEERGLPTRSDLEVELKIAIERGELPPSIDAKVVAGKLWNIFYERGKEVPKTTVTKLLAKKASMTIEQAKQVLKALENHDVVVTRGRKYVITTPYERVRLSRGYH